MLAIVAQVPSTRMNMDFFQAMDEEPIFDDVSVWNRTAMTAESLPMLTDEAIRQAYEHKGVAVLTIPKDFGWAEIDDTFETNASVHEVNYPAPTTESVDAAVKLIKDAKSPMIYFGVGAKGAAEELKAASEKFKMPLVSSVLGKGILEDNYPAYLGSTGRVAPKPGAEIGFSTDLIIWVGNNVPFSIFLFNKKAKVIQIDVNSEKFGKRHHTDVAMLADAKKALAALVDAGEARDASAFYNAALADKKNWDDWQASFKDSTESPVRPEPIFDVLNQEAADNAVFAIDVGNVNIDFERLLKMHGDQKWCTSGIYATMGWAVPASLSAKTNFPDREVYSLSGDGGFAMLSEELLTQVKYNMHVVNIVFSNETLGFIEAEQRDDSHQPQSGTDLIATDWAKVGEGYGAVTFTVKTKAEFKQALEDAKKTDKPVLIDVKYTHKMPFTTEHMFIDPSWQDQAQIDEFVKTYDAQDLKPFSYFLKQAQA